MYESRVTNRKGKSIGNMLEGPEMKFDWSKAS